MKNKKELNDMAAALPPRDLDLYTSRDYHIRQYHKFHDSYMKVHEYLNGTSIGSDLLSGVWRDLIEIRGWFNSDLTREDLERLGTFNRMNGLNTQRWLAPFTGHTAVFVATVGHRGCYGPKRTLVLNDVRLHGGKMVLADHVWMKWDDRWTALEPLFGGTKVLIVGLVKEYKRTDTTRDLTIKATRIIKL